MRLLLSIGAVWAGALLVAAVTTSLAGLLDRVRSRRGVRLTTPTLADLADRDAIQVRTDGITDAVEAVALFRTAQQVYTDPDTGEDFRLWALDAQRTRKAQK